MSALLWKAYFEDDLALFQQLLGTASSAAHEPYGSAGPSGGASSVAAGTSPGRSLGSTSPTLKGKSKGGGARTSAGKGKQSHEKGISRAEVNSKDAHGVTILHLAASSAADTAHAFANTLLKSSLLDLYVQDYESGWTALHRALYSGSVAIARELMVRDIHDFTSFGGSTHAGGLIKIKDHEGNSPFDVYARTIAPRSTLHTNAEALLPAGSDDEDDGDGFGGIGGPNALTGAPNHQTLHGNELFMFGSNKNLTLGFKDQDDRHFPERITLARPDHLLRLFRKEHNQLFPPGPFAEEETERQIPAYVRFQPLQIQEVQLSKLHSAVLTTDPQANLYICGFGSGGRLGTGDEGTRFNFTSVLGGGLQSRKVAAVGLGQDHTLVVTTDGEVFSWGSDRFGQLGYPVNGPDSKDEDPVQLLPRQVFGPLKREIAVGCAASRVHSVVFTNSGLYTFGKNDGQLGLVDSDARLLDKQVTPRKVAAALFTHSITMVTAIDRATSCLLENHEVWIFANFGYRKVTFPFSRPDSFIRDSFSSVDRRNGPNHIVKICSGGDTVTALARFGEIFNVTISKKVENANEASASTTHPTKIKGAFSDPLTVWSPRKEHMAAVDVDVGQDGSVILCTQSGSVWQRVRRAKIKDPNPMQMNSEYQAKDHKYSRVPGLTEIRGVRSNAFGAFAAIRRENDVMHTQIRVSPSNLWEDMFPLLSFNGLGRKLVPTDGSKNATRVASADRHMSGAVREAVLTSRDIETELSEFFERHGPSQNSDYDVKIGSTVSDIRIPCHQFILIGRSRPLQKALLIFKQAYFAEIPEVCTVEYDNEGIASVIFQGLDILAIVNIVFFLYTDNIMPVWNIARKSAELAPRYRQVRVEVMKAAASLELRGLEKAARLMSEPAKTMHLNLDTALFAPEFLDSGDIEVQLEDGTIRLHRALICQRCPFFEGMFHGRASGGWLASRRQDMDEDEDLIQIDLEHIDQATFQFVLRYLYGDVTTELFSDCTQGNPDDFLDTILDVLSVANELMIDRLAQICQEVLGRFSKSPKRFVMDWLTILATMRNLCWLLNAVHPCSVTEYKHAALEYICLNLEGMMENRLLDELDEDILVELDQAIRDNQLAFLPISRGEFTEERLLDEHPELIEQIDRGRKVKVDYMRLRSHLVEDEARLAKLQRSTMQRSGSSTGDLMFDMDEDGVDSGSRRSPGRAPKVVIGNHQEDGASTPSNSLPRERGWQGSYQESMSPGTSSLAEESLGGTPTPPASRSSGHAMSPAPSMRGENESPAWTRSSFSMTKLNMKEIMAQASEGQKSNISTALAAASPSTPQIKASHFAKLSQKERKRQSQAQKEAASKADLPATASPNDAVRSSPWQLPSTGSPALPSEPSLKPARMDRRQVARSPSLTMRQTIPGNSPNVSKSGGSSRTNADGPRRTVSSPSTHPATASTASPGTPQSRSTARPPTSTPSSSSPVVPKSIRHIPPAPTLEPLGQSSMADILAQQQTEKHALHVAATSKRSLQEIQEEQAFQEWWNQEEAAAKAQIEQDAALAAALDAKEKGGTTAAGRGRGRGRGGRGTGNRGSNRARRTSAAAEEPPIAAADGTSHATNSTATSSFHADRRGGKRGGRHPTAEASRGMRGGSRGGRASRPASGTKSSSS